MKEIKSMSGLHDRPVHNAQTKSLGVNRIGNVVIIAAEYSNVDEAMMVLDRIHLELKRGTVTLAFKVNPANIVETG